MTIKKLGVLILTPFYEPNTGGVETHLKDLTDYLCSSGGYEVCVVTYQPLTTRAKAPLFTKSGLLKVIRLPWVGCNFFHKLESCPLLEFLYITPVLFLAAFFFLLLNGKKVSVIHAQGLNAAFIGRLLAPLFSKRLVVSIHSIYNFDPFSKLARLIKWTLSGAHRVLTLSQASKTELIGIGLRAEQVGVYTYWVDQKHFSPIPKEAARARLGWKNRFTVLFVGRLIEKKGADILLRAAEQMGEAAIFVFIGDGPFEETIKDASSKLPNVRHLGKVDNRSLPLYYSAADILCVPSKYEEGFGRVILEALSCGIPVVASSRGGIPEAVNETVGILVDADAASFKKAVLELYNDRDKLNILRNNCRNYALKRFGLRNAEIIIQAYL